MNEFVWGVATSAYQIEGGRHEDGKGDSIWDTFSDQGRLADRGDVTCDHFHRWEEDLDLMADLGVNGYRFSIAWSRVIPDGDGDVNQSGLDFYRRLVDGLLERGIEPYPTLYHWDLPQALQDQGGWANRKTVADFARYAEVTCSALGEVTNWITHNEPWVATFLGHLEGVFAPGHRDWAESLEVAHHILLSHGEALERIRTVNASKRVGLALDCRPANPASDSDADVAATRAFDGFRNRWFFDPVFGKGYPDDMMRRWSDLGRVSASPEWLEPGDLDVISSEIDFVGVNYYTTQVVSAGEEESERPEGAVGRPPTPGFTEMGWKIDPAGLGRFLKRVDDEYRPKSILITENGASYSDGPKEDGVIDDSRRIDYLDAHIDMTLEIRSGGVPVDGYFVWSLLDNLEWVSGYSQRFGLVWVDHDTLRRLPKESFGWYRDRIAAGA